MAVTYRCMLVLLSVLMSSCGYGCPKCSQFIDVDDKRCAKCREFGKRGCGLSVPANYPPDTKHQEAMAPCDPACCPEMQVEAVGSEPEQAVESQPTTGKTHRFRDNWGEPGCAVRGEMLTLRGRVRVEPFRKGTSGALLDEGGGGESWVLTYRAEGVLLQLDGTRVEVRGRACDKIGEAISGKHFDLESLIELGG